MLFLIFVIATLLEIYVLVSVGEVIGGFSTILLVIITALIGSILLKQQGFSTLRKVQEKATSGQIPAFELLEGVVILISGILLLTPGFITDGIGLLGLIPFSRRYFIEQILNKNTQKIFIKKQHTFSPPTHSQRADKNNTIEGEFWEE